MLIGISERGTWDLVYDNKLPTVWIGHRRLVPAEAINEFIATLPREKPDLKKAPA